MAFEFKLPDLGEGLTEAEIVKWLVKPGDPLEEGQVFVQVETDIAVFEIPSPRKGMVLTLEAAEGEIVQVGRVIIVIGEAGEIPKGPAKTNEVEKRPSGGVVGELEEAPEEEVSRTGEQGPGERSQILAVPLVRRMAKDLRVDLSTVKGSGPQGRITSEDVQRAARVRKIPEKETTEKDALKSRSTDPYGSIERIPLRGMRKTIAQAMVKSKSTIPHAAGLDEADITQLLALKAKAKERAAQKNIHLAAELSDLSEKARSRTIDLADLKGGTFTITNFGAMGGIFGFPIIRYPEVAILGMGRFFDNAMGVEGRIEIRKVLPLSLSFDHRVVDGAEAVRFMRTVIELLEDPGLILMEE